MPRLKKPVDESRFYIKKEDLLKAILDYQAVAREAEAKGLPLPQQPNVIGQYILDLCEGLGTRWNFKGYSFVDVMISDAIEQCVKAVMKFDYEKMRHSPTQNIFNYFTMVAWRAFQFRIVEERKQHATMHKHFQHTFVTGDIEGQFITDTSNNEYSNRVIEEYETKHLSPSKKQAKIKTPKKKEPKGLEILFIVDEKEENVRPKKIVSGSRNHSKPGNRTAKRKVAKRSKRKLRRSN